MKEYNIVMLQSSIRITYLDSWLQLAIKQKTQAKILSLFTNWIYVYTCIFKNAYLFW